LKTDDDITKLNALTKQYNKSPGLAMPTSNSEIHIDYSPAIKEKIAEKRKLRKLWQISKCSICLEKQVKSCYQNTSKPEHGEHAEHAEYR